MHILVCVKQVPDSTARLRIAPDGRSIVTDGITWAISPYDEYAVELALEQKDGDASTTITVVSAGPPRARDALRQALAMGCDAATLVTADEKTSPLAVARALAKVIDEASPDVVLCGALAADDDSGFVGPALADVLGWPHVARVEKMRAADGGVELWKSVEGGHEVWRAAGRVLATVQRSEKEPRYPSLPGIMKAKKKEIAERDLAQLGVAAEGPSADVLKMEPPPQRGGGKILKDGDAKATAAELARLLREEAKVL